jgi:triphosphatase
MATEIELKLSLSPDDVAAFRRAGPLCGVRPMRRKLTSIYYDTPDCELQKAGMALRLRKSGGTWTQTLKGGASGTGGLHERHEWESKRPDATIDLAALEGTMLDKASGTVGERLRPAFTVELQRETWDIEPVPGTRVEVALDRGQASVGDSTDRVCEVEIELKEGDRDAAFDFARALATEISLHPSAVTKAERGYRLLRHEGLQPVKSRRVTLEPGMGVEQAARALVAVSLEQLQANEEGVLASADPEFVHQARVGLRRMRSALRIFRNVLPPEAEAWRTDLGELARTLGEARDWDVFATETLPPLSRAFGDPAVSKRISRRASAPRKKALEQARSALLAKSFAALVLDLTKWLSAPPRGTAEGEATLLEFATRLARKRHRRLIADAQGLAQRTPEERHAVRIDAKRLRYAVDGFASLFKQKRVERYLAELADLQDVLGTSNDAATAARLLAGLDPPADFAAFARGYLAARIEGDSHTAEARVERLMTSKQFWS